MEPVKKSWATVFAKFLRAYVITLMFAIAITKIGPDFPATFSVRLGYLFFYAVGFSALFALIGLVAELSVKRKEFEGWIFLYVSLGLMWMSWIYPVLRGEP
jgi:predicted membrane channel-forming protein YqfA (hemolysin III family)